MIPNVSAGARESVVQKCEPRPVSRAVPVLAVGVAATGVTAGALVLADSRLLEVCLAVMLVCLAPTSSRLDRRVATNLSLTFGLVPFALSVPSVLGTGTAPVTALSIAAGASVAAVICRPTLAIPSVRWRDSTIAVGGLLAGLVALPLRSPAGPREALSMLSANIDNAFHFEMFLERRLMSAGSPLVAANADTTGFAFDDYPQWLHKLLTILAQIAFGDPRGAPTELVRFAQLEWLAFVGLVALVTAAFVQASPERTPPILLAPALAVVLSLMVGVPGPINLVEGHLSFLMAACAPLVMFLLAYPHRRIGPGLLVVLAGLLLVAGSWFPLLPMAGAALFHPLKEIWRRQRGLIRWLTLGAVGLALTATAPLFMLRILSNGAFRALLNDGEIPRVGLPTMAFVLAGSLLLMVAISWHPGAPTLTRHIVMVIAAGSLAVALALYMEFSVGELRYYFWKLALGSLIVSVIVAAHGAVVFLAGKYQTLDLHQRTMVAVVVVVLAALGLGSALQESTAPSIVWAALTRQSLSAREVAGAVGDATLPLRLAAVTTPREAARTCLLATRTGDMNPVHAAEWFHALSHSATRLASNRTHGVYGLVGDPSNIGLTVELAKRALVDENSRVVVTDPDAYRRILASIDPARRPRVSLVS